METTLDILLNTFIFISLVGGSMHFVGELISLYRAYQSIRFKKKLKKELEREFKEITISGPRGFALTEEEIQKIRGSILSEPTKKPTRPVGSKTKIKKS